MRIVWYKSHLKFRSQFERVVRFLVFCRRAVPIMPIPTPCPACPSKTETTPNVSSDTTLRYVRVHVNDTVHGASPNFVNEPC